MDERQRDLSSMTPEEKRRLLKKMLERKGQRTPRETRPGHSVGGFIVPPDYALLEEAFEKLESEAGRSIYFIPSEGLNNNLTTIGGSSYINFCGYNYLGMSGDPAVSRAAKEAIDTYGTSVSASRLASGERPLHRELEEEMAGFLGTGDAIVFIGGYSTNESVIGHLCGSGDIILYDSLIHASVQTGCRLSGAAIRPFAHNNWESLDNILKEHRAGHRQALIVIEGVYSMDGDIPDLPRFIEVKKRHDALLMVDEAHSIGVLGPTGRGIGEHHRVDRPDVDIWMGTLSKAFASCGGYIAGNPELIRYLRYTTPGFVYSVGISPPNAAAALESLRILRREPERVTELRERSSRFLALAREAGLDTGTSGGSAVIPVMPGDALRSVRLFRMLYERGIYALPIMYPAVPDSASRLRFFISSTHTPEQIEEAVDVLAESIRALDA